MLTGQLVQLLRLFYRSKTIFVGHLPLSDEHSEWLRYGKFSQSNSPIDMRNQANKMVLLAPMDIYICLYNCWGRAQLNVSKNIIIHLVQFNIFEVAMMN